MEKQWIDSEDGKLAVAELASLPETRNVIRSAGTKLLNDLSLQVLEVNLVDEKADRKMLISRAELDGARKMLKYLQDLFESPRPKNKR